MRYLNFVFVATIVTALAVAAKAAVRTETVEYKQAEKTFHGYVAYDDAVSGKRPGVLVFHEWWGLVDYPKERAKQLAQMGYVAFCADMYGEGKRTSDPKEAGELAGALRSDRALMRQRAAAALDVLKKHELCDAKRVAAIGYCFGGGAALELARSGAAIAGVVSFHGNLDTPMPAAPGSIAAKVLVFTGGDDKSVPEEQVAAFENEMRAAKTDWQVVVLGGAVHSFTNPASGNDPSRGAAYNAAADRRSWGMMKLFFAEVFGT